MKLRFVIFFAIIFLLFGCDKKESKVENKLGLKVDPVLIKISLEAGVIYTTIHLQKDLSCILVSDTPAIELLESLDTSNFAEKECIFFTEAVNETLPVFENIKKVKTLPEDLYAFAVFLPGETDDTYRSETIGLFSSLESCERIETIAREYDIPSKKCYKWRLLIKR